MAMLSLFRKSLLQSGCIPPGSRVLVAVSGGADSVALLALLRQVSDSMALHLEAAHLDHALRETSSDDARFVEQLCVGFGIPVTVERSDVASIAKRGKGNLEEIARNVRRNFLVNTAKEHNCQLIALGHHADDQAETFLMRLLRGSGPDGLAGMRVVNQTVVRPLLSFRRDELLDYLQNAGIPWREDESNFDQAFTRNRVRHDLLPVLKSYNPNLVKQLASLCDLMRQDDDFWVELVAKELARCGRWQEQSFILERPLLHGLAPALVGRLVRAALRKVRGDLRGVTATHIAGVLKLLRSDAPQGELDLPGAWVARRYEVLSFCKRKPETVQHFEVLLTGPGICPLPDGRHLHLSLEGHACGESPEAVEFAAAAVPFPLRLRHRQPGDRFRPTGMLGTKKLQDFFVDLKLAKEERENALVLLKDHEILWAVGLRRSEGWRPRVGEPVLRIMIKA